MDTKVRIDYNLKSLIKSEYIHDIDPDLNDKSLSDLAYL
jgi:hypothetical protein